MSPPISHISLTTVFRPPNQYDSHDNLGLSNNSDPAVCGISLKYISLVILAVQNSALTIIMHYSRVSTPPSQAYSAATAVLMNEILKGLISFIIAFARTDPSPTHPYDIAQAPYPPFPHRTSSTFSARLRKLWREIFSHDCWKLSIPAVLYVIQNNLQFVAASNLPAATFQVTYQMKVLTTAAFSVLLLRKKLLLSQWLSLFVLAIGVGVVQIQVGSHKGNPRSSSEGADIHAMNALKGFLAVAAACLTSGLAGVYFEMVLKNSQASLWVRNVQLSLFSLLPAVVHVVFSHRSSSFVTTGSSLLSAMFHNFGTWAWATVTVQVLGGLVTAMVIKYSDNILKGFATSLSIVISFLASIVLFDFHLSLTFILGSVIVLVATWLYNQQPRRVVSNPTVMALMQNHPNVWSLSRNEKKEDELVPPPKQPMVSGNGALSAVSSSNSLVSLSMAYGGSPPLYESDPKEQRINFW